MRGGLVLCALVLVAAGCKTERDESPLPFEALPRGAQMAKLAVDGSAGTAVVLPLSSFSFRVLAAGGPTKHRKIDHIVRSLPQVVAVNGSFFDEKKHPMGAVVDEGRPVQSTRIKPWGAFVIHDGVARIISGKELDPGAYPDLVVQGQPRLVKDGKTSSFKPQRAERTAVCLRASDKEGDGYRAVTLVTTGAVELKALAAFLARPAARGGLGCEQALNLDGGPSTQLYLKLGDSVVQQVGAGDVPNALAAVPRERTAKKAPHTPGAPKPR